MFHISSTLYSPACLVCLTFNIFKYSFSETKKIIVFFWNRLWFPQTHCSFTHLAAVEQLPWAQTVGERVKDQILLTERNFRGIFYMFFIYKDSHLSDTGFLQVQQFKFKAF